MGAWRSMAGLWLLVLCTMSCGGDDGDGGSAGMPAPPPMLGEPCTTGTCGATIGTACASAGTFRGVCSIDCNNDASCQTLGVVNARCFRNQCALRCGSGIDCPEGTQCTMVDGREACVPTR